MKPLFILTILIHCTIDMMYSQDQPVALIKATIIDVSDYGNKSGDLKNSLVIFQNGRITYADKFRKKAIPENAEVINLKGMYILPGLIDGFAILNSQSQANAYLYMGVTTVATTEDGSYRGDNFLKANPCPRLERMIWLDQLFEPEGDVYMAETSDDIEFVSRQIDKLDSLKEAGYSIAFLHHRFPAAMFDKVVQKTKQLGMATIGEMQYAPYKEAANAGVQAFVHTLRYSLEAYPDSLRDIFIHYPDRQGVFFDWYDDTLARKQDTALLTWASFLARSQTALMPTLAMSYAMQEHHDNLWEEPVAAILDSSEIHLPMNKHTGHWTDDPIWWKDAAADHTIAALYVKAGCHFLTGSGTDAFGSMPGISEHMEIKLLNKHGLTKRQAVAAATNNFSIFFNWTDRGSIVKGKFADIIVLSKNPLDDLDNLKNIELLFLNGEKLDRSALLNYGK